MLSTQRDNGILDEDLQVMRGLAELGMEERFRGLGYVSFSRSARRISIDIQSGRENGAEPDRENWKKAHELYLWAFKVPKASDEQKKLAKILKKPVPESIQRELFEYDTFLRGLGRMSLSQCTLCSPISVAPLWLNGSRRS